MTSDVETTGRTGPTTPGALFASRRERLLERIGDGVAIVPAAPELMRSRDTELPYRQSSDLHYLTGFPEPGAVAVLTPQDPAHRFTLFVRDRDPEREAWSGPRAGVEGARELHGADAAYPIAELEQHLPRLLRAADRIHYPLGVDPVLDRRMTAAIEEARRSRQRGGQGPIGLEDLEASLGGLRRVKDPHEIEMIRTAARISAAGHRAAMARAAPGVGEWEIEAAMEGAFRSHGATGPAFPSIVGSGPRATILHYVANDRRTSDGDLVLVDAGAEWGMYCGDISRTFPVSGRFTRPQREIYEVVLAAEEAGIAAALPGAPVTAVHDAAVAVLVRGMVRLGLLTGDEASLVRDRAYRRFYVHQTSHWLGIDVHDVGLYHEDGEPVTLEPGMVLTVEPGLYLPAGADDLPERYRGIGVRIEDDVLITDAGNEVLTRDVPVAPDEVEAAVNRSF
jgi:Xaa-Pro aminopeptidase